MTVGTHTHSQGFKRGAKTPQCYKNALFYNLMQINKNVEMSRVQKLKCNIPKIVRNMFN